MEKRGLLKRKNKKAQLTIIIIVAIIIIATIVLFMLFRETTSKNDLGAQYFKDNNLQPKVNNIQDFIVDCLETTSEEALIQIGIQGGYNNPPESYYDMEWTFVPYYYNQGELLMPDKSTIEQELSSFVNENIGECIDHDTNFDDFEITFPQPQTTTQINTREVTFTTNILITIEHGGSTITFELNDHPKTHPSKLKDIIDIASYITESHIEDPNLMCVNCLTQMAKDNKVYIDFMAFTDDTTLVMITENQTLTQPYVFEFLNKYNVQPTL